MNLEEFRKALSSDVTEENAQLKKQLSDLQTEYHEKLSKLENENDSLKESCRVLCNRCFALTRGDTCLFCGLDYPCPHMQRHRAETVANSCSIIHQIADKGVKLKDFSYENLTTEELNNLYKSIGILNIYQWAYKKYEKIKKGEMPICKEIRPFINTMDKKELERQMIQLLPSSYNWKRTLMLNYAVLMNIYISHKNNKLDEWRDFCNWIEDLPYSELITGKEKNND